MRLREVKLKCNPLRIATSVTRLGRDADVLWLAGGWLTVGRGKEVYNVNASEVAWYVEDTKDDNNEREGSTGCSGGTLETSKRETGSGHEPDLVQQSKKVRKRPKSSRSRKV